MVTFNKNSCELKSLSYNVYCLNNIEVSIAYLHLVYYPAVVFRLCKNLNNKTENMK